MAIYRLFLITLSGAVFPSLDFSASWPDSQSFLRVNWGHHGYSCCASVLANKIIRVNAVNISSTRLDSAPTRTSRPKQGATLEN